jgi:hypothetical protein
VGSYSTESSINKTLVESWNGTSWYVTPSPNQGKGANRLNGVSCTNSTACVAVGFFLDEWALSRTLIETWNGSRWSVSPSPDEGSGANQLNGVACPAPTLCRAVGSYVNDSNVAETLVEIGSD